ncbi:class I SAM-dependent methyltransferase [Nocardioides sp. B-3]|uniref:class I SAM-dependent methyltransferase n=1 Tax=Nocardioides sp. B-3 TaxID=2895565 RepID=UPI002152817B|nr:class I SAM-dependent methyltransferase [Nocardioides sp. B-3]UUZ57917.1 class I SAM-dependent methyltransferase [Nocardioides sp. B-3]
MDVPTLEWLLTDPGRDLLEVAMAAYVDAAGDPVRAATQVRKAERDAERAAAALTQAELRTRAVAKFGALAPHMFFTPDALEQATRLRVAEHRAARLAAAQPSSVVDPGCGIGGDLIAFARAGLTAAGVDLDPVRVVAARANPAALGLPGAVRVADVTSIDPERLRRGLRRPGPTRRPGPGLRHRRLDSPVAVRPRPAGRSWRREGGSRHPPRRHPRRRGGRVGQRCRRREGGGAVGAGVRDHRPPRHRHR